MAPLYAGYRSESSVNTQLLGSRPLIRLDANGNPKATLRDASSESGIQYWYIPALRPLLILHINDRFVRADCDKAMGMQCRSPQWRPQAGVCSHSRGRTLIALCSRNDAGANPPLSVQFHSALACGSGISLVKRG